MFKSISDGKASVVTSQIDKFVREGIQLESGEILEADVIVTATGFNMNIMGDIDFAIDSAPLNFHDTVTYRGMMFTGVPNLAWVFGYFRGSWTIRSEIIAGFVCRLLNHMKKNGAKSVEPALRKTEQNMALFDWMDDEDFNPNYLIIFGNNYEADYWNERENSSIEQNFSRMILCGHPFCYCVLACKHKRSRYHTQNALCIVRQITEHNFSLSLMILRE